jgi:hypothetical protein
MPSASPFRKKKVGKNFSEVVLEPEFNSPSQPASEPVFAI